MTASPTIREAARSDVPLILALIRELAAYEKLAHEVVATEEGLSETLFGREPRAEVLIAEVNGAPAGFALFFHNYSTFLGRALLGRLAAITTSRGCGRLEWAVLDWNESAIGFYRNLGATAMNDWTVYRLTGEALGRLAEEGRA